MTTRLDKLEFYRKEIALIYRVFGERNVWPSRITCFFAGFEVYYGNVNDLVRRLRVILESLPENPSEEMQRKALDRIEPIDAALSHVFEAWREKSKSGEA
jgi:hypothetical protein